MFNRRHIVLALKFISFLLALAAVVGFISLNAGNRKLLSVQSGSMAPAISKGELVSVKRVPFEELSVGDVITFVSQDGKTTVTHRIMALLPEDPAGNNISTKGDANSAEDEPIEAAQVVGRVEHGVPYLGRAIDLVKTWPGLILAVYIPAIFILLIEIRKLASFYRSQHYVLPEWMESRRIRAGSTGRYLVLSAVIGLSLLLAAIPVRAALINSAALSGNTITVADIPEPEPEPEPEPPKPAENAGGVTLRRVFITCEEGESVATHVQIILYNSSRQDVDVSDWTIKSGDDTLLTLPDETTIPANDTFDTEAEIIDGISYSNWDLTLFDNEDEQKDENSWDIQTTRECRVHQRFID